MVFKHPEFNVPTLLALGERHGWKACSSNLSQTRASGSLNCAITISFEDGVEWIIRSPRTCFEVDVKTAGILIASEVATLNYIRQDRSILVLRHLPSGMDSTLGLEGKRPG